MNRKSLKIEELTFMVEGKEILRGIN